MIRDELVFKITDEGLLRISSIVESTRIKIQKYNRIEMIIGMTSMLLLLPLLGLIVAIITGSPFIGILVYVIITYYFGKKSEEINNKNYKAFYDDSNYNHYYYDIGNETEKNNIIPQNQGDPIVNVGLLCFDRGLEYEDYLSIGNKLGENGYSAKNLLAIENIENIKLDVEFYIIVLFTESNCIIPIINFDDWYRLMLGEFNKNDEFYGDSQMSRTHGYIRDIVNDYLLKLMGFKTDLMFEFGYIIFRKDIDGYGLLLREEGKTSIIYDPILDIKIPEDELDPIHRRSLYKDPRSKDQTA